MLLLTAALNFMPSGEISVTAISNGPKFKTVDSPASRNFRRFIALAIFGVVMRAFSLIFPSHSHFRVRITMSPSPGLFPAESNLSVRFCSEIFQAELININIFPRSRLSLCRGNPTSAGTFWPESCLPKMRRSRAFRFLPS